MSHTADTQADTQAELEPAAAGSEPRKQMTIGGAVFLGVGSMVGAGIFALIGEAGAVAGSALWISFGIGAVIAGMIGYTIATVSAMYPSRGGLVAIIARGFGDSHLTGATSWLFYASGLIVASMVSVSFGSYATELFLPDDAAGWWVNVFASFIIIAMALVNRIGPDAVGRLQSIIVLILLGVFTMFVVTTIADADFDNLDPSGYPSLTKIISAVALTFFAYLGFAVIANTAEALPNPKRDVPLATYLALGVTGLLYVLIAVGVFGALGAEQVVYYGDTALAEAARPSLGDAGFTMMAVAALLATASSTNATAFAADALTAELARNRQFPPIFGGRAPIFGTRGLAISVAAILVLANLFDLSAIADIGSAVALAVFALVGFAALKLRSQTGANPLIIMGGITSALVVLVLFMIDTARENPEILVAFVAIGLMCVVFDVAWKHRRDRSPAALVSTPS